MERVPNLRLRALDAAVREAELALLDVAPDGTNPTGHVAGLLTGAWTSDTSQAQIADLDGEGRLVRQGFLEALERLRSLAQAEAPEPTVPRDDPRADPRLYPEADPS